MCLKARFVRSGVTQRTVPNRKRLPKRSPGPRLNLVFLPGGISARHNSILAPEIQLRSYPKVKNLVPFGPGSNFGEAQVSETITFSGSTAWRVGFTRRTPGS